MKKLLLFTTLAVLFLNRSEAQTSFGLTAGAVFSGMKFKEGNVSVSSDRKSGFTVGVLADIAMDPKLSLQPALNYVQKGGEFDRESFGADLKTTLNYLELPINIVYNAGSGSGRFFVGAGPVFSLGLSGKQKMGNAEVDVEFGSDNDEQVKRMETGVNLLAGYRLAGGFFVSGHYNAGLSNLANDEDVTSRQSYFGIKVGMMLGK